MTRTHSSHLSPPDCHTWLSIFSGKMNIPALAYMLIAVVQITVNSSQVQRYYGPSPPECRAPGRSPEPTVTCKMPVGRHVCYGHGHKQARVPVPVGLGALRCHTLAVTQAKPARPGASPKGPGPARPGASPAGPGVGCCAASLGARGRWGRLCGLFELLRPGRAQPWSPLAIA